MSIKKDGSGGYTLECDLCGHTEDGFSDFMEAVYYKKASGWKARKDEFDKWIDRCPSCVEEERELDW
jgi:hypothetical protein